MQITRRNSPNHNVGRQGWTPDFIVCHTTGGTTAGAIDWSTPRPGESVEAYHRRVPANDRVSYHFIVAQNGTTTQTVDITNTAWANGTANDNGNRDNRHSTITAVRERRVNANQYTISIGFGDMNLNSWRLTQQQIDTAATLLRHIQSEVNKLYGHTIPFTRNNIIGHNQITPITRPDCPGRNFQFNEILAILNAPTSPSDGVADWAREAWNWAVAAKITDGTRPTENLTRQEAMTLLHRFYNHIR